tara:strand:+ start:1722 stop:1898 length:177 start_codon:yes stop_codon:yes gene_type:complete
MVNTLETEIIMLRQAVADEQKQKYEAYKKISALNTKITQLEKEIANGHTRVLSGTGKA